MGTGGMTTKLLAAEVALANKIPMVIANGEHLEELYNMIGGQVNGTLFID